MANETTEHDKRAAEDKKRLDHERQERAKANEEREKKRGRPTPTQEEADLANLGHHPELSADGSEPDPNVNYGSTSPHAKKHMEAEGSGGGYQTRQSTPASAPQPQRAAHHQRNE